MFERQVVYEPDEVYPLHIAARQYWLPEFNAYADDPDALTLILLHSTSFHKETWQPTVEHLFERLLSSNRSLSPSACRLKVKCAWAIDCPNHGDSAQLNDEVLQRPPFYRNFGCEKYAQAVHRFLSAGAEHGAQLDFKRQKLVGIGHSLGGVAITILQNIEPLLKFSSVILVEPMLSPQGPEAVYPLRLNLVKGAYERRDVWSTREDAHNYLKSRRRTKRWDPRILELYTKHGLRSHPGSKTLIAPYEGVALACSRDEEVAMYRDADGATKAVADLDQVCTRIPVSVIFGDDNDFMYVGQ
ncbi:Alpha/beta hydrolase fold-1 [Hygrophoropsis aurantiaca]|uniref:Alpha/beta hydrolase fold-1 n=1 Tax=Hygrophoropsis aurantiaca TaxID=72124 RepID=A0ACB8A342_9AGAM|nr:Alpha/beta hydrolase fold-1 [Hygrophoropsis aurantiaca]